MSRPIIEVNALSKKYRLGVVGATTLREDIARHWQRLRGRLPEAQSGEFWALRDVSFSVQPGEVLGILGRNGAGKSTLLKILSRITEPTSGTALLRGRMASLLEVGTGFHPDLTGRENVFLNGTILGMKRGDIAARFDAIVDFADVSKFIDTPVKHYSSGMRVRLAFAVAAHLDAEIVVIDEVLAVGDAAFQRKCLGKLEEVSKDHGRTVLFVSHDLGNVTALSRKGMLLEQGRLVKIGTVQDVVSRYLQNGEQSNDGFADLTSAVQRTGSGEAMIESIELLEGGRRERIFVLNQPLTIILEIHVKSPLGNAPLILTIKTRAGTAVHDLYNWNEHLEWNGRPGRHRFTVTIPAIKLHPGSYAINAWLGDRNLHRIDYVTDAISFDVVQLPDSGIPWRLTHSKALVVQSAAWTHECSVDDASSAQ